VHTLRSKLTTTFVALGLLGLLVIGITSYVTVQWRESEDEQARHYVRSLRLQEVRALTFEAYVEVPDAIIGVENDAREDYVRRITPIGDTFAEWAELAEDDAERSEVEQVRAAAEDLAAGAERIFTLVDEGRREDAAAELERVEEELFEPFDALTTQAVTNDRAKREVVRADAGSARRTATITLVTATLGVISLLLLVGAYLNGGVFRPIGRVHAALSRLADGHTDVRLPEDGDDEIAGVSRQLNLLAARLAEGRGTDGGEDGHGPTGPPLAPLRVETVDPAALLHEVMERVGAEVVRGRVSTGIDVEPGLGELEADRVLVRDTLSELVRNALDAIPDTGGRLELSAAAGEPGWITFEVSDNGPGLGEDDLSWIHDDDRGAPTGAGGAGGVGLRLATDAVRRHGGRLELESRGPSGAAGTVARVALPLEQSARTTR